MRGSMSTEGNPVPAGCASSSQAGASISIVSQQADRRHQLDRAWGPGRCCPRKRGIATGLKGSAGGRRAASPPPAICPTIAFALSLRAGHRSSCVLAALSADGAVGAVRCVRTAWGLASLVPAQSRTRASDADRGGGDSGLDGDHDIRTTAACGNDILAHVMQALGVSTESF